MDWLAFGYLRTSPSRITYFDGSQSSFELLLSYSTISIGSITEEDGFLIASLVDDYNDSDLHISRNSSTLYISIQAVQTFYSLTHHALNLLENEILQSHSIVRYDPSIERLWTEWVGYQIKLRDHDKGNKLLEILDYPKFLETPDLINNNLFNDILISYGHTQLPEKLKSFHNKTLYPWLFINYKLSKNNKNIFNNCRALRKEIKELDDAYSNGAESYIQTDNSPLTHQPFLVSEKVLLDNIVNSESHFLASSFLAHYYNLSDNNYLESNLEFLKKDLAFLDTLYSKTDFSKLIIYYLGRRLDEGYLNYLYNAKNISQLQSNVFDINFFSELERTELPVSNFNEEDIQNIVNDVKAKAEEIERIYNESLNKPQEQQSVKNTPEQNTTNDKEKITKPHSGEDTSNGLKAENVSTGDSEGQNTKNNTNPNQLESETAVSSTDENSISGSQGDAQPAQQAANDLTDSDTLMNQPTPQDDKENTDALDSENQDIARQVDESSDDYPNNKEEANHNKPSSSNKDELNKIGGANQIGLSPTKSPDNQVEGVGNKSVNTNVNNTEQENQDLTSSEQMSFLDNFIEVDRSQLIQDAKNVISELASDEKTSGSAFKKHFLRKRPEYIKVLPNV
ncbi:hypothetical protein LK453_13780 [Psychrobacter sanguinis]|nr:hypothetical protein LK453_13780 [Psychrobacter sanguinis]